MGNLGSCIRDKKAQSLFMDFSHLQSPTCDIDLVNAYGKHYIFGEIKNEYGTLSYGQQKFLESLVNSTKSESACLYITHDKKWQDGDTEVDVAKCQVAMYYLNGGWHIPKRVTTVDEALTSLQYWWKDRKYE